MRIRCWQFGLVLMAAGLLAGCRGGQVVQPYTIATGGSPSLGKQIIRQRQCGECHTIPGIHHANGVFGPPLVSFSRRTVLAGNFPNTPDYLVRWIMSPKLLKPKTAMPDLGLTQQQARNAAAYLYTLR